MYADVVGTLRQWGVEKITIDTLAESQRGCKECDTNV